MHERDVVAWTTMIAGYTSCNRHTSAWTLFSEMLREDTDDPNAYTLSSALKACKGMKSLPCGSLVHGLAVKHGMGGSVYVDNALLDMYATCCVTMDDACVEGIEPSSFSFSIVVRACTSISSCTHGKQIHGAVYKHGLDSNVPVMNYILDMYCRCSSLCEASHCFHDMTQRDYKIAPNQEIYGCVVDLLGRGGRVEKAYELIESTLFKPDESVWAAFLGACKAHRLLGLGKLVVRRVLDLRPNMTGIYLMLSNMYAADGKWGDCAKMRKLMSGMGNKKEAGRSWVKVRDQVYSFVVGDKVGSHMECVYEVLETLVQHMKTARYIPDVDCLIHDLEDGPCYRS
ncbi:hypothetical protein RJ639_012171 [Escallonia herrerae]|uniref:Pentatricopeptide repeat-containing protein n=1 Tax=Escallonia herrerae TaxID=1293975 RepID=A0AA88VVR9_9ASTE|nr:hypothetical protein RJ639_012171 [Escallonia herrerae]